MQEHQNKGVAGKAFCKLLNEKEMDDGRFSLQVACEEAERRGLGMGDRG
jgi:hypothetical protein